MLEIRPIRAVDHPGQPNGKVDPSHLLRALRGFGGADWSDPLWCRMAAVDMEAYP